MGTTGEKYKKNVFVPEGGEKLHEFEFKDSQSNIHDLAWL